MTRTPTGQFHLPLKPSVSVSLLSAQHSRLASVNHQPLRLQSSRRYLLKIPVIASVAADVNGQSYNINADIAAALGAEKLILLTDVSGLLRDRNDPASLVKEIDIKGLRGMIDDGTIAGGMIPKINCCVRSLAQGVEALLTGG